MATATALTFILHSLTLIAVSDRVRENLIELVPQREWFRSSHMANQQSGVSSPEMHSGNDLACCISRSSCRLPCVSLNQSPERLPEKMIFGIFFAGPCCSKGQLTHEMVANQGKGLVCLFGSLGLPG